MVRRRRSRRVKPIKVSEETPRGDANEPQESAVSTNPVDKARVATSQSQTRESESVSGGGVPHVPRRRPETSFELLCEDDDENYVGSSQADLPTPSQSYQIQPGEMPRPSYECTRRPSASPTHSTAKSPTMSQNLNAAMSSEASGTLAEIVTHSRSMPNTPAVCAKRPRSEGILQLSLTGPETEISTPFKVEPQQVTHVIHGTAPQPTRNLRAQWSQIQHAEMIHQVPTTDTQPMSISRPTQGYHSTMGPEEVPHASQGPAPQTQTPSRRLSQNPYTQTRDQNSLTRIQPMSTSRPTPRRYSAVRTRETARPVRDHAPRTFSHRQTPPRRLSQNLYTQTRDQNSLTRIQPMSTSRPTPRRYSAVRTRETARPVRGPAPHYMDDNDTYVRSSKSLLPTPSQSSQSQPREMPRPSYDCTRRPSASPTHTTANSPAMSQNLNRSMSSEASGTLPSFHDTTHQTLAHSRSPSQQLPPPTVCPQFSNAPSQPSTSFPPTPLDSATSRSPTSTQSPLKCPSSTSALPPTPTHSSQLRLAERNPSFRLTSPQPPASLPSTSGPRSIVVHPKLSPPDFDASSPSTLSQPTTSEQCSESHSTEMQPQPSATSSQTPTNPQLLSMETSMQTMPTPQILHTTDEHFDMLTDPDLAYS
uniref:Serine/arginine repetitive matrix protein 2-like n=2 Tax=Mesocestoides corti TaxID=53468 RepID=A0A5K3G1A8_MESCO